MRAEQMPQVSVEACCVDGPTGGAASICAGESVGGADESGGSLGAASAGAAVVGGAVAAAVAEDAVEAASGPTDSVSASLPAAAPRPRTYARGEFRCPEPDGTVAAPRPGGAGYRIAKRAFDVCFSAAACALLAVPVAALCAAICADSPGAPFFRQERVGRGGRAIRIWKLRTMVADAHSAPERYMTPAQLEAWGREQKLDDDPRVTRVGRFLRRTSLDELPQFINVLAGDLSVIGPRPVTPEETWELGDGRDEFLSVRPGITGWWQVTERNAATWENGERQMLELFYVRHASLALDLRIFVRTFKAMFVERTGK